MYFSCPILETADYKWQDQTLRLNLCAVINWQIKPNAASGVFHESVISFSNWLFVWIFPFCLDFLTSTLYLTTFFLKKLNNDTIDTTDVPFDYLDACSSSGGGHCNFPSPNIRKVWSNLKLRIYGLPFIDITQPA